MICRGARSFASVRTPALRGACHPRGPVRGGALRTVCTEQAQVDHTLTHYQVRATHPGSTQTQNHATTHRGKRNDLRLEYGTDQELAVL